MATGWKVITRTIPRATCTKSCSGTNSPMTPRISRPRARHPPEHCHHRRRQRAVALPLEFPEARPERLGHDYTNLFQLVDAVNTTGTNYTAAVEAIVDIEQWMRIAALEHIIANWIAG